MNSSGWQNIRGERGQVVTVAITQKPGDYLQKKSVKGHMLQQKAAASLFFCKKSYKLVSVLGTYM